MKSSKVMGFVAISGVVLLIMGVFAFSTLFTSQYFAISFVFYLFLIPGAVLTWIGFWGFGVEHFELRNSPEKRGVAYLNGFLGAGLIFVGTFILCGAHVFVSSLLLSFLTKSQLRFLDKRFQNRNTLERKSRSICNSLCSN